MFINKTNDGRNNICGKKIYRLRKNIKISQILYILNIYDENSEKTLENKIIAKDLVNNIKGKNPIFKYNVGLKKINNMKLTKEKNNR